MYHALSVTDVLPDELIIGDWQPPNASKAPESAEAFVEKNSEDEDYNKDMGFIELGSTI